MVPRAVVWTMLFAPGMEHLRLESGGDDIRADGVVVAVIEGTPIRASYEVRCDRTWTCRAARVSLAGSPERSIDFRADGRGGWTTGDGQALPELAGCLDVDIAVTPFTNTLPIRRLPLAPAAHEISVVYVHVPTLEMRRVGQRYTCLERRADGGRWRYEGLDTGFTAELEVDSDGLVVEYPGVFRRVWPAR